MKYVFTIILGIIIIMPLEAQIEVITNGKVKIGNPSFSNYALNVGGSIKATRFVASGGQSYMGIMRASKIIDQNSPSFHLDAGSTSSFRFLTVYETTTSKLIDKENDDFYLNPNDWSVLHKIKATKIVDRNSPGFYLDPHATSNLKNVKVAKLMDDNDPAYYVDPGGMSFLNLAYFSLGLSAGTVVSNELVPDSPGSATSSVGKSTNKFDHVWTDELNYTSMTQWSDERTKENIKDMQNPMSKLMALTAKTFDYKAVVPNYGNGAVSTGSNLKDRAGFIAQEVKEVIPEIVSFNEDTGLHAMNYVELIPMLVKAIQEQQGTIETLEKELDLVKRKLAD